MECPVCGFERRCKNNAVTGWPVCRMHGADVGRIPKRGKYYIAKRIAEDYNRILNSQDLIGVSMEIAMLGARTSQLQVHLDSVDHDVAVKKVQDAISILRLATAMQYDPGRVQRVLTMLDEAIGPLALERESWSEIRQNLMIHQKLVESEREWISKNSGVITPGQFVESVSWILELCMTYIPNPSDRLRFYQQASSILPGHPNENVPRLSPARTKELGEQEAAVTVDAVAREVEA